MDTSRPNNNFDERIERALTALAYGISRRGILARVGQLTLGLAGASILNSLPADRRVVYASYNPPCGGQPCNCNDFLWCGMSGVPCASCPGGSNTSCPGSGCYTAGSGWSACCYSGSCGYIVVYYDCCDNGSGTCHGSSDCTALCKNAGTQPFWCNGGTDSNYRCTLATIASCRASVGNQPNSSCCC